MIWPRLALAGGAVATVTVLGWALLSARDTLATERASRAAERATLVDQVAQSEANRRTERQAAKAALDAMSARAARLVGEREQSRARAADLAGRLEQLKRTNDELATTLAYRSAEFHRLRCDAYAAAGYVTAGACVSTAVRDQPADLRASEPND